MKDDRVVDHYGAQYGQFASRLYAEIRTETFGEDIGQNGWLTSTRPTPAGRCPSPTPASTAWSVSTP